MIKMNQDKLNKATLQRKSVYPTSLSLLILWVSLFFSLPVFADIKAGVEVGYGTGTFGCPAGNEISSGNVCVYPNGAVGCNTYIAATNKIHIEQALAGNYTPNIITFTRVDYRFDGAGNEGVCLGVTTQNPLEHVVVFSFGNIYICSETTFLARRGWSTYYALPQYCSAVNPPKNKGGGGGGCGGGNPSTPNPIKIATGTKWLVVTDYLGNASLPTFSRYYDSSWTNSKINIGSRWTHTYAASAISNVSDNNQLKALRKDGTAYVFNLSSSSWLPDADITDKLIELKDSGGVRTGWSYNVEATGEVESYDAAGKLLSITDRVGLSQTMTYSCTTVSANCPVATPVSIAPATGLIIKVADNLGRNINFTYDASNNISSMTNPQGGVYIYAYSADNNKNLTSVTYPNGNTKTYHYENTTFVHAMTGVTDELGVRYATYNYDTSGRATSEFLSGNVEQNTLNYRPTSFANPTSTIVTDPRGSIRTYNFTTILGVVKSTGQSQPAGSGCAASAAALTYDANGNIASRTDFKGNKTVYAYDMSRNLETSRTEGLTATNTVTPATRTITTTYHPTWRLPLVVIEYTGGTTNLSNGSGAPTGTALRSTTTAYDTKGNITSITEADPVRSTSRSTTMTYTYSTAVPGLVLTKVVDGSRTDVSDISTYTYYPHDATCTPSTATPIIDPITNTSPANLGCRGQLSSMSNALNQTTTYDRYNHHGQIEQMTDANGLVTSSTYDLRQRLLTRTAGTETTTLVYDNVGQVTQLTFPDASSLNYTYDAAHRLTDVQDNLGNKVHYTLDSEGNRTNETTTDPANVLTKTLTRSYDALNRLQQVTGVE